MSGPDLETMLRESLLRAQDAAPIVPDLLGGVARRRRAHRRLVATVTLAAVAVVAAIAVPVSMALTAAGSDQVPPTGSTGAHVHGVATPLGVRVSRWTLPVPDVVRGQVVVGNYVFGGRSDDPGALVRVGKDGVRTLRLTNGSQGALTILANATAVYATDLDANGAAGQRVWRIDPNRFNVAARASLPEQSGFVVATDAGVYWSTDTTVNRLDPMTLVGAGSYRVPMPSDHTVNGLVRDRIGVAAFAAGPVNKDPWMLPLSADLVPGAKTAVPAGVPNPVGSACGINYVLSPSSNGARTTTVTLQGLDPKAEPFTVNGDQGTLIAPCSGGRGYLGLQDGGRSFVVAFHRTGPHTYGPAGTRLALAADDTLYSIVQSGGDLWVISQFFIDRFQPTNDR